MKTPLPKTSQGFTLVELLVVVAIIAILATIGAVIFTDVQKRARDGRRQSEVVAIAKALEANKASGSTSYPAISTTWFAGGAVPIDPRGTGAGLPQYSLIYDSSVVSGPPCSGWVWNDNVQTPGTVPTSCIGDGAGPDGNVAIPSTGNVPASGLSNFKYFVVCARLEQGASPFMFCVPNSQ